jgi:benzoylformate decarboxylase
VIVVGQQDRRQIALSPFLTGRNLERLAGDYPVWTSLPTVAADVPGAIVRAWHEARLRRGPALVVVPMGDWDEPCGDDVVRAAPDRLLGGAFPDEEQVAALSGLLAGAASPVLVVGAGVDDPDGWAAVVALAERLACPVWQDTFSSRAGFPQDHPQFAGHLPWRRAELRELFSANDVVVAVGTPAFRLYTHDGGLIVEAGTRVAVVSDDPEELARSRCELAVLASPARVCGRVAERLEQREGAVTTFVRPGPAALPAEGESLTAAHVLDALGARLAPDTVLVEEAPSHRPELLARLSIRNPLGFVAVANGALGFGLAASIGLRMALRERPVVAVLGDGSSTYSIQALWSAATYGVGVVFVVLGNGRYAIMDSLAAAYGGEGAWPSFASLDLATVANGFGCPSVRVTSHEELVSVLDETIPTAVDRMTPLLVDVRIS